MVTCKQLISTGDDAGARTMSLGIDMSIVKKV